MSTDVPGWDEHTLERAIRNVLASPDPETLTRFVELAGVTPPGAADDLLARRPEWLEQRDELARRWAGYVKDRELSIATELLRSADGLDALHRHSFGTRAYARVRDMFTSVDFARCRCFVMVGCGPLPVTMLHVLDRSDVAELRGLDVDPRAVELGARVLACHESDRGRTEHADGRELDYSAADVVYVANLASPKRAILERIARTVAPGTAVVLREPVGLGRLLSESGVEALPPGLRWTGEGSTDTGFLSRDAYLRAEPAAAAPG